MIFEWKHRSAIGDMEMLLHDPLRSDCQLLPCRIGKKTTGKGRKKYRKMVVTKIAEWQNPIDQPLGGIGNE